MGRKESDMTEAAERVHTPGVKCVFSEATLQEAHLGPSSEHPTVGGRDVCQVDPLSISAVAASPPTCSRPLHYRAHQAS